MTQITLKRVSGWVLGGVLLLGAAGCGGGSTTPAGPGNSGAAPGGEAKPKVDKVIIAMPAPARESNNANADLDPLTVFQLRPMLEWLVGYGTDGEFEPMLASKWEVGPDGRSLKFTLRQGVQFHNEKGTFNADDVLYSMEQMVQKESIHPHAPIHRAVKLEKTGEYEVTFTMARPNAEYLHQLSRETGSMAITSKADAESLGNPARLDKRPLASTGAYQFKEREQGRSISFTRVPYKHYRVTPDFPEMELRWMAEASTRLAGLLTNEIHITQLPQDLTPQAEAKGMKTVRGPVTQQRTWLQYYGMYVKDPKDRSKGYVHPDSALMDVRVRKALDKAIDRDALNKAFFANKAELMYIDKMPKSKPYFNPEWEKNFKSEYGYDTAAARALLQEAGYGPNNPLKLRMRLQNLSDYGGSQDVQEAIVEYWRKVGIDTELVTIQENEFRNVNDQLGHKDLVVIAATSSFDVQAWRVYNSSAPPRGGGELWETDPLVYQLLETLDEKEQYSILRKLGDISYPLHMHGPLFWLPAELIINPAFVSAWPYPGSVSRVFSHFDLIKATK